MGASCKPAPSALHQVATARAGAGAGARWRRGWPPTEPLGFSSSLCGLAFGREKMLWSGNRLKSWVIGKSGRKLQLY